MKHLKISSLFIGALILLTACPYESNVPITKADGKIYDKLMGKWYEEDELGKDMPDDYYEIKKLDDNRMEIVKFEKEGEEGEETYGQTTYITHRSVLKDKDDKKYHFLNMKKDGKFYLHRVEFDENQFTLYEVTDNIDEKFTDAESLMKFVKKNMHLSFFYNKDEKTYFKGDHTK